MAKRIVSTYRHRGHYFTVEAYQRFGLMGAAHRRWKFTFGVRGEGHTEQDFTMKRDAARAAHMWAEANPRDGK